MVQHGGHSPHFWTLSGSFFTVYFLKWFKWLGTRQEAGHEIGCLSSKVVFFACTHALKSARWSLVSVLFVCWKSHSICNDCRTYLQALVLIGDGRTGISLLRSYSTREVKQNDNRLRVRKVIMKIQIWWEFSNLNACDVTQNKLLQC